MPRGRRKNIDKLLEEQEHAEDKRKDKELLDESDNNETDTEKERFTVRVEHVDNPPNPDPAPIPDPVNIARKYLCEDEKLQKIVALLKENAEEGNVAARTLYAIYHVFIGANIPDKQTEAYAEALKWFFMNRMGALESKMLLDIVSSMVPGAVSFPGHNFTNACNVSDIERDTEVNILSAEKTALLLSIPICFFDIDENVKEYLEEKRITHLAQLYTDERLQMRAGSDCNLQQIMQHFEFYLNISDDVIRQIKRRFYMM